MSTEELVIEKLRGLPPDQKKKVLDFIGFLRDKKGVKQPLQSLRGIWADLAVEITEEDIAEALREMWCRLPRESC